MDNGMKMTGAQQLRDWIDRRGYTQAEAADMFQVAEAFVSMLVNDKRTPGLGLAVKIEQLTGIPAATWTLRPRNASKKARKHSAEIVSVHKA